MHNNCNKSLERLFCNVKVSDITYPVNVIVAMSLITKFGTARFR